MSLIVCSLCSNDGILFIPSYKSTLMNSMAYMNSPLEYELPLIIPPWVQKTLIIDMMAVLQSMKKRGSNENYVKSPRCYLQVFNSLVYWLIWGSPSVWFLQTVDFQSQNSTKEISCIKNHVVTSCQTSTLNLLCL